MPQDQGDVHVRAGLRLSLKQVEKKIRVVRLPPLGSDGDERIALREERVGGVLEAADGPAGVQPEAVRGNARKQMKPRALALLRVDDRALVEAGDGLLASIHEESLEAQARDFEEDHSEDDPEPIGGDEVGHENPRLLPTPLRQITEKRSRALA